MFILLYPVQAQEMSEGGYADRLSVSQGDTIHFFLSTPRPQFDLSISRWGGRRIPIATIREVRGGLQVVPDSSYRNGCGWQERAMLAIGTDWKPGVYFAEFPSASSILGIVFYVRAKIPGSYSPIAVSLTENTWQAYNNFGGKSLYNESSSDSVPSTKVSFQRPLAPPFAKEFFSWAAKFIAWTELNNIPIEITGNQDLSRNDGLLDHYKVLISVGHDEYWTRSERNAVEAFIAKGGNLMMLAGASCWWQVRYEDSLSAMVCYRKKELDPYYHRHDSLLTIHWFEPPIREPENRFLGGSARNGGYVNSGNILPASEGYGDYTAYHTEHWIYKGTGLHDGDHFGFTSGIVGYEVDGALFTWSDGFPVVTGADGTPVNYLLLGLSPAMQNAVTGVRGHATMGLYQRPNGGWVFNAATTGWVRGLAADPVVQTITRNVLDRFLQNRMPPEIHSWSPFNMLDDSIHHEYSQINSRVLYSQKSVGIPFSVSAFDPSGGVVRFRWLLDSTVIGNDSTVSLDFKSQTIPEHSLTVFVANDADTASLSWTVQLTDTPYRRFAIPLSAGYNAIAFPGVPLSASVEKLFAPVLGNGLVSIFSYENTGRGKPVYDCYLPGLGEANTLQELDPAKAYVLLLADTARGDSLIFWARPDSIAGRTPVLRTGYNLLPFRSPVSVPVSLACTKFQRGSDVLEFAAGLGAAGYPGNVSEFYPGGTLQAFNPCKSYWVKLGPGSPASATTPIVGSPGPPFKGQRVHAPFPVSFRGLMPAMFFYGDHIAINGASARPGTTFMAKTASGAVFGSGAVNGDSVVAFPVYLNDTVIGLDSLRNDLKRINLYINGQLVQSGIAWQGLGKPYKLSSHYLFEGGTAPENRPRSTELFQNYPNPANPGTVLSYYLESAGSVELSVYSILGKEVRIFRRPTESQGAHQLFWDGLDNSGVPLASGVYLYRLTGSATPGQPGFNSWRKLLLLR